MKRIIGVECWADYYFFSKLLLNEKLIRKEKNKSDVIKGIKKRSGGGFSIGIVDHDNEDIKLYFKELEIEYSINICEEINLVKIKDFHYYIIQLQPKAFENWIVRFVENDCNKKLIEFGYNNLNEFIVESKVIDTRLINNERFLNLIRFVLQNCDQSKNHISKLKTILKYLVEKNYQVDLNELINV